MLGTLDYLRSELETLVCPRSEHLKCLELWSTLGMSTRKEFLLPISSPYRKIHSLEKLIVDFFLFFSVLYF